MVKKINPWDNGGDEDGWSLGGEMFKKNKIVDFSKIRCIHFYIQQYLVKN